MSKKPVISKEPEVLLKLLRIALGNETDYTLPKDVDWKEVVRLSYEHKVSALAVDGLQMTGVDLYDGLTEEKANALKSVLVPWIKDVENTEWSYCYYVEVLKTLCQIFRDNGLTPIILKGYGLSLNYPRPSHRGAGDIDLFLVDKEGKPAAEEGDRVLRQFAVEHTFEGIAPHHTHFEFKGITVENHYELSNSKWNTLEETIFLERLKSEVVIGVTPIRGLEIASEASSFFSVLYQIRHLFSHFYNEQAYLRQICDFALYIRSHQISIPWDSVSRIIKAAEIPEFFEGILHIMEELLGVSVRNSVIQCDKRNSLSEILIRDLFALDKSKHTGILNFNEYYRKRWHYNYFYRKNWIKLTVKHIIFRVTK